MRVIVVLFLCLYLLICVIIIVKSAPTAGGQNVCTKYITYSQVYNKQCNISYQINETTYCSWI
ncbi:hypothetical protein LSH36_1164g00002, partial [Paralvinella palmiformis]